MAYGIDPIEPRNLERSQIPNDDFNVNPGERLTPQKSLSRITG